MFMIRRAFSSFFLRPYSRLSAAPLVMSSCLMASFIGIFLSSSISSSCFLVNIFLLGYCCRDMVINLPIVGKKNNPLFFW